ncbi:MAG TPA: Crp/Fnr family transcriptional regulator [Caulobacteraceae bacterium]|nr:Crp/Fnr family transcriptional regulator [Caulobacteraceae bacterium]
MPTYSQIEPYLEHIEFGRGEVFYEPSQPIDKVYFPHTGVISLLSVMEDGSAVETSTIGSESAVGLLAGMTPINAFSRIVGQTPGLASSIEAERLRTLTERLPMLRDVVLRHYDALLANAQQSVACNALHDVQERFCRWLLICHDRTVDGEDMQLTQEALAMMLGVQRTTVSQVASLLQEAGLIRYQRGRMRVIDRRGLERRACECYRRVCIHNDRILPTTPAVDGPCEAL